MKDIIGFYVVTVVLSISLVDIFFLVVFGPLLLVMISKFFHKVHKRIKKHAKQHHSLKESSGQKLPNINSVEVHEHHKYDGFSDEETRMYAKSIGASNFKQLSLIQQYDDPDYETAKKIVAGNFATYQQFLDAESKGATTETEMLFINKLKAPNLETALKVKELGFNSYNEYQTALSKGASNHEELQLIERMGTKTYGEALKILTTGFEDSHTYRIATAKGINDNEGWKKYLKDRDERINTYKNMKKNLNKEYFMKEFGIEDINELLLLLEKYNVPLLGNSILFSYDATKNNEKEEGYSEFELNDIVQLDVEHAICKICLEPLIGQIGTCPKCATKMHYDCISGWVLKNNNCPTCMEHILVNNIQFSEQQIQNAKEIKCILCNRIINPLQTVIRCDYCFTIYHKTEFLEYAKVKGKCLKCNQVFKF